MRILQPPVLICLALCLLLAGCGQKGALYRDQAQASEPSSAAVAVATLAAAR